MSTRLTSASIAALPVPVGLRVKAILASHRTRRATFEQRDPSTTLYLDEDQTYEVWRGKDGKGEWHTVRMAGEWNATRDAMQGAISGRVGERVPIKPGTFAIEHGYFCGTYFVHVYHWGVPQLEA